MGVFFRGLPGPEIAGLLAVNERCVRLSDGLGPTSLESSRTGPLTVQHTEESKEEQGSAVAREWRERQCMVVDHHFFPTEQV